MNRPIANADDASRRRPTIADVARRAGVSPALVSFAVNDRPGVSAPTRSASSPPPRSCAGVPAPPRGPSPRRARRPSALCCRARLTSSRSTPSSCASCRVGCGDDRADLVEHFQNGKGIKRIARELGVARDTVRKVLRSGATEFVYKREVQPQRRLGAWIETLTAIFEAEDKLPRRERARPSPVRGLRGRGYDGAAGCTVREERRTERARAPMHAFVPLRFDPGEAYQFDWSHEAIESWTAADREAGADAAVL